MAVFRRIAESTLPEKSKFRICGACPHVAELSPEWDRDGIRSDGRRKRCCLLQVGYFSCVVTLGSNLST